MPSLLLQITSIKCKGAFFSHLGRPTKPTKPTRFLSFRSFGGFRGPTKSTGSEAGGFGGFCVHETHQTHQIPFFSHPRNQLRRSHYEIEKGHAQ